MDKTDTINSLNQTISINERKSIIVSGVKKIESFDNEEFLMETTLGFIIIKGRELEIVKLDTYQGTVSIKGVFVSLTYIDYSKKSKEESMFSKLFK